VLRIAAAVASVVTLLPGPYGGHDQKTLVPERPTNEQALLLICSCEVKSILFAHSGWVYLDLRGGRTVFVARPDRTALAEAAKNAAGQGGYEIAIGME
jgi:hypothetical protein